MKITYIPIIFIMIIFSGHVSAKTVEYEYNNGGGKDIQLMGNIINDRNIEIKEVDYTIFFGNENSKSVVIPKYTVIEEKLIDLYGTDKLNKLITNNTIGIEGSYLRFTDYISDVSKHWYDTIKVEEKKELKTNLIHSRELEIESDLNQTITFKLFPISPNYYSGTFSRESDDNGVPNISNELTLFDTNREYYSVHGNISNKNHSGVSQSTKDFLTENNYITTHSIIFNKKYELYTFKQKLLNGKFWIKKSILPYYEFEVELTKGRNLLKLSYLTYHKEGDFLKIK